jgi:hypothetical protein
LGLRITKTNESINLLEDSQEERIEALKERERQIRAAISAETVKRRKREFKEFERLKNVVGGALLSAASDDPSFSQHLKDRLCKCVLAESEKGFLRSKGWA